MTIKAKVALGVVSLFTLILAIGGLGLYYIKSLSSDAQNILKDNYESLEYTKGIVEGIDQLAIDSTNGWKTISDNLKAQEANITETGERELTFQLRAAVDEARRHSITDSLLHVRELALAIQNLNMQAIIRKNEIAQERASSASTYMIVIGSLFAIAAFTFIVNFPGYVANPIAQLTSSIKSIANKDYEERLRFDRKDEFDELAQAFNLMAEKLDEYEHSNLAKILFEKTRIETLINRMSDPVIGLDENAKVIFVNEQAIKLLSLTEADVIGKYAPDVALNNDLFRNLIRGKQNANESLLIKVAVDGKENYYSKETIQVKYTPTGERKEVGLGSLILLKNITSYKELDLAKTHFMATISHELKTPIASLQMGVKLLKDGRVGGLNEEQANLLKTLDDETSRLSKITHELLDLSQLETGNIRLSVKDTDPQVIVQHAVEATKFQAERKQVTIKVSVPNPVSHVQSDVDKTTWVLVNFLSNAIRYSPEGEQVLVDCEAKDGTVIFRVTDHGPGIEQKYLGRLFEKFFQVPGTASGTGLGLAISKEFIEAQGGHVAVESEVGKGSVFEFMLPRSKPNT